MGGGKAEIDLAEGTVIGTVAVANDIVQKIVVVVHKGDEFVGEWFAGIGAKERGFHDK